MSELSLLVECLQLADDFDIVVNCIGYGAREVCSDPLVQPIRGQMIRVRAPWIKHFYYTDDNCYMIPKYTIATGKRPRIQLLFFSSDTIVLGGTRQTDDENTHVDLNDKDGIWQRCLRLCPSLAVRETREGSITIGTNLSPF